jgi:hypothetical protein
LLSGLRSYLSRSSAPLWALMRMNSYLPKKFTDTYLRDPASAKVVQYSWFLLGLYIGAVIMFVPVYAIYRAFRRIL